MSKHEQRRLKGINIRNEAKKLVKEGKVKSLKKAKRIIRSENEQDFAPTDNHPRFHRRHRYKTGIVDPPKIVQHTLGLVSVKRNKRRK